MLINEFWQLYCCEHTKTVSWDKMWKSSSSSGFENYATQYDNMAFTSNLILPCCLLVIINNIPEQCRFHELVCGDRT